MLIAYRGLDILFGLGAVVEYLQYVITYEVVIARCPIEISVLKSLPDQLDDYARNIGHRRPIEARAPDNN